MSDTMFYGVLRMPYAMAMGDDMSRIQFYDRAQEAADRVEVAEKRIAELEDMVCKLAAPVAAQEPPQLSMSMFASRADLEAARAAQGERQPECAWRYDEDDCAWETACGEYFVFMEGTPSDNKATFCHCCGKKILEMYPA